MVVQVIRTGATRTVFLVGRYAVKVPSLRGIGLAGRSVRGRMASFAAGLLSNQSEHIWHTFGPWGGRVAPVLCSLLGGIVQVYPRCAPLPEGFTGELPQLDPDPGDGEKPDNYGVLNGVVVRIDYDMD